MGALGVLICGLIIGGVFIFVSLILLFIAVWLGSTKKELIIVLIILLIGIFVDVMAIYYSPWRLVIINKNNIHQCK